MLPVELHVWAGVWMFKCLCGHCVELEPLDQRPASLVWNLTFEVDPQHLTGGGPGGHCFVKAQEAVGAVGVEQPDPKSGFRVQDSTTRLVVVAGHQKDSKRGN